MIYVLLIVASLLGDHPGLPDQMHFQSTDVFVTEQACQNFAVEAMDDVVQQLIDHEVQGARLVSTCVLIDDLDPEDQGHPA